jgi:hypothetical protein
VRPGETELDGGDGGAERAGAGLPALRAENAAEQRKRRRQLRDGTGRGKSLQRAGRSLAEKRVGAAQACHQWSHGPFAGVAIGKPAVSREVVDEACGGFPRFGIPTQCVQRSGNSFSGFHRLPWDEELNERGDGAPVSRAGKRFGGGAADRAAGIEKRLKEGIYGIRRSQPDQGSGAANSDQLVLVFQHAAGEREGCARIGYDSQRKRGPGADIPVRAAEQVAELWNRRRADPGERLRGCTAHHQISSEQRLLERQDGSGSAHYSQRLGRQFADPAVSIRKCGGELRDCVLRLALEQAFEEELSLRKARAAGQPADLAGQR